MTLNLKGQICSDGACPQARRPPQKGFHGGQFAVGGLTPPRIFRQQALAFIGGRKAKGYEVAPFKRPFRGKQAWHRNAGRPAFPQADEQQGYAHPQQEGRNRIHGKKTQYPLF
jgi:hypothetical protein